MHYFSRYDCYVNILANLQSNHSRFARKDLKEIEIINYLSSVYYYNGAFLGSCNFNDNINVLKPVAIGRSNESYEYNKDMAEIIDIANPNGELVLSIKIKASDLLFPLTAIYKTTAKQFKIFVNASVELEHDEIQLSMIPFKKSTSVKESYSSLNVDSIKIKNDLNTKLSFNFNSAMVVDILKFYEEDEFIIIDLIKDKDRNEIKYFNLSQYNKVDNGITWTFKNMSFDTMNDYLRKNKS